MGEMQAWAATGFQHGFAARRKWNRRAIQRRQRMSERHLHDHPTDPQRGSAFG